MSLLLAAARDPRGRGQRCGDGARSTMNVYFLHGVGMWPGLFAPLLRQPYPDGFALPRPGYAGGAEGAGAGFAAQVSGVRSMLDEHGPGVLVGVSGGATVALATAIEGVDGVRGVVTHEPLVGPQVPELHARVHAGALAVRDGDPERVDGFLRDLYGPPWADIGGDARRWAERHRETVSREVGDFVSFAPTHASLSSISIPHITTVGARSAWPRHEVAALLADSGAVVRTIPDCGHLVPLENPDAFAAAIDDLLVLVGGTS